MYKKVILTKLLLSFPLDGDTCLFYAFFYYFVLSILKFEEKKSQHRYLPYVAWNVIFSPHLLLTPNPLLLLVYLLISIGRCLRTGPIERCLRTGPTPTCFCLQGT